MLCLVLGERRHVALANAAPRYVQMVEGQDETADVRTSESQERQIKGSARTCSRTPPTVRVD